MAGPWDKYASQPAAQDNQQVPTSGAAPAPWQAYAQQQAAPVPTAYSGQILPISVDQQGNNHFDSNAGILGTVKRAFMAPGDAMNGNLQVMGPDGNVTPEAIQRANEFAGTFSPINPAVRAGEAIVPGASGSFRPATVAVPTADELKAAGSAGYDALRELGTQYSSKSVSDMAAQIQQQLENDGFNATTAPKTFQNLGKLQSPPDGSFATNSNLETARRTFGQIGQDFNNPSDRTAGKTVRGAIDDFVMAPPEGSVFPGSEDAAAQAGQIVTDARGNIAASKRSGAVSGIQDAAELRAAAANSGQNVGNSLRQRVASLLLNPKQISGFSDPERAALEEVVRGSIPANATRIAGNVLGGGGGLGAAVAATGAGAGAGYMTGNPLMSAAGLAAPIVGAISKKISNSLTEKAVNAADEAIRSRSPLYQALQDEAGSEAAIPTKSAALIRALLMAQNPQNGGGGGF